VPDATDAYYLSLGRMICRAAEAEAVLESLAAELNPEAGRDKLAGLNALAVTAAIERAAPRWPRQEQQIRQLVRVMREGAEIRNWLVHAWVLSPQSGDWVELQKPIRVSKDWGRRRIERRDVDALAARFVWVLQAVTRVLTEHGWEEQGTASVFVDSLSEPPPLPPFEELPLPNRE
jgi:hypothetical protein